MQSKTYCIKKLHIPCNTYLQHKIQEYSTVYAICLSKVSLLGRESVCFPRIKDTLQFHMYFGTDSGMKLRTIACN